MAYGLQINSSGILAKSFVIAIPSEPGIIGAIETAAEKLVTDDHLSIDVTLTATAAKGGVNLAVAFDFGSIHEAFDATEQVSGVEGLLLTETLGSGKAEKVVATVVNVA